jgi:hypothetical protein
LSRVYNVTPEGVSEDVSAVRRATPGDPELETRLALAEAELRAMKDMLAEVRKSRDDWQAQAERLALSAPTQTPIPAMPLQAPRRSWWRRLTG